MKKTLLYSIIGLMLVLGLILPMAVPVLASEITVAKNRVPDESPYLVGETIHFVMNITNPATNTETNTLINIWDTLPDGSIYWLVQDGVDPPLVQTPGQSNIYTYDYVVDWGDAEYDAGLGYWVVRNTFEAEGFDSAADDVYGQTTSNPEVIPPPPVGGEAFPISKLSVLVPWIALGAAIIAGAAMFVRRRKARS